MEFKIVEKTNDVLSALEALDEELTGGEFIKSVLDISQEEINDLEDTDQFPGTMEQFSMLLVFTTVTSMSNVYKEFLRDNIENIETAEALVNKKED